MLEFLKTLTIAEFKQINNCNSIDIIRSPKTDKLFFSANVTDAKPIIGAVTTEDFTDVHISRVSGNDGEFWLLHTAAKGNIVATL